MIPSSTRHRGLTIIGIVALAAGCLAGCAPEPEPTPTPTSAFASEEEAFAAAEEVYRAYNEAGNERLAGNGSPDPQDFLIGTALEGDIEALRVLDTEGLTLEGTVDMLAFTGISAELASDATVTALVCLDASATRVVDSEGVDVTPASREETIAQVVTFTGSMTRLQISAETAAESDECP
ncbi:hypothetical protein M2317_003391 [Microbacterium sp. ZKA21]|uniref:hypothetical protein n=1 Tax=Microbacterium sp. ZKA21 TaxID=3381694 RepID=UPI003D1A59F7